MALLFFHYLAIYSKEIYQKHKIFVNVSSQFFQILNSYSRNGQKLLNVTQVVKFRQIWSHWS